MGGTLNDLGMRQKLFEHKAVTKWDEVVGPQVAASSVAERIRDGVLYVCCKSSMWSNELTLLKDDIVNRLNKAIGKKVVIEIRFTTRGFAKARQRQKEELSAGSNMLEAVPVDEADVELANEVASSAPSDELAEKIKRAIISGKQREKG